MKCYKQQKRKRVEITRKQDECTGVSVKKSANGTGWEHQKITESTHLEPQIQIQVPSAKIKLQLFPINEQIRLGLEKDGRNPFLELTLSARKKISSVVRHLDTKWGSSNVAKGLLTLFPYNTKLEQVALCKRWTLNDTAITAWEVYVDVGSPSVFRLRYGWSSNLQQEMFDIPPKSSPLEAHTNSDDRRRGCSRGFEIPTHEEENIAESRETTEKQINVNEALGSNVSKMKALGVPNGLMDDELATDVVPVHSTVPWDDNWTNLSIGGLLSEISLQGKINRSDPNSVNKSGMQQVEPISDISIGGLLTEASLLRKWSNPSTRPENESSMQPIFLASSDISIGGLFSEASLLSNQIKCDKQTMGASHAQFQSPWDDNFTTLSIGGLLSEVSLQAKAGGKTELEESKSKLCNSFDTQLNALPQMPKQSSHEPNVSILDAEETCHGFPIRKLQLSRDVTTSNPGASSSAFSNVTSSKLFQFSKMEKETIFPNILKMNPLPRSEGAPDEDKGLRLFRHPSATTFMT
ncbi:hypothetical protein ACP275_12G004000 [Erythranthe tilingii]